MPCVWLVCDFASLREILHAVDGLVRRRRAQDGFFGGKAEIEKAEIGKSGFLLSAFPISAFRWVAFFAAQSLRIAPFREDFTTDGTDDTDKSRLVRNHFQSVKSVKSAVQFLACHWSRCPFWAFSRQINGNS